MSKRLFAILLCLAMLLSLAACGQDGDNSNTKPQPNKDKPKVETLSPDAEPTDEEWYQIRKYNGIADALNHFEDEASFRYLDSESGVKYYGQEALAFCYEQLQLLSGLEKWNSTKWAADYGVSIDCQSLMERFTVSDMIKETYISYDILGNVLQEGDGGLWVYDTEGRLASAHPNSSWNSLLNDSTPFAFAQEGIFDGVFSPVHYVYNDKGLVEKYQMMEYDQIREAITPEYDANGMMVSATMICAYDPSVERMLSFTYDDQGRYAEVTYREGDPAKDDYDIVNVWTFTYDAEGKLLKKICEHKRSDYMGGVLRETYQNTTEYTFQYDNNGFLLNASANFESNLAGDSDDHRTYEYTCDDGGRPCKVVIRDDYEGRDRVEIEVEYGSYYIYNPAK